MQKDFEQYIKWAGLIQSAAVSKKLSNCEMDDFQDLLSRYRELCESLAELAPDDIELQKMAEHSAELESAKDSDIERLLDELIEELEKLKAKVFAMYRQSLLAESAEEEELEQPEPEQRGPKAKVELGAPHRVGSIVFVRPSAEAMITALDEQRALKRDDMQMQAQSAMGM